MLAVRRGGPPPAAPKVDWVIASDLTQGMLESTRKNGAQKGITNASLLRTDSENIALADASVDTVSVRIAPHHFSDVQKSIRLRRVSV